MQNEELPKEVCKKCGGIGHFSSYDAPRVIRKYCDCEIGEKREKFIKDLIKTKDVEPVWELFTL